MSSTPFWTILLILIMTACIAQAEPLTVGSTAMSPTFTAPPDGTSSITNAARPAHTPTSTAVQAMLTASPVMIEPEAQHYRNVIALEPSSPEAQAVLSTVLAYHGETNVGELLPDTPFEIAEVRMIMRQGDWVLVQASFSAYLEPGIFLLRRTSQGFEYDRLLWGGQADSVADLRLHLIEENADVPQGLLDCFEVAGWFVP